MKLGQTISNMLDSRDPGHYQITCVRRIGGHWLFTADAASSNCLYATIGGTLIL